MKNKKKVHSIFFALAVVTLLTACSSPNANKPTTTTKNSNGEGSSTIESSLQKETNNTSVKEDMTISIADVIRIYQEKFPDSDIVSIELDDSFGHYYFKVEGMDDMKEYELRINSTTSEVDKTKAEPLDRDEERTERQEEKLDIVNLKPLADITKIAEEAGGKAIEWDLDKEIGVTCWTVKVQDGRTTIEILINAQTGEVLEKEVD